MKNLATQLTVAALLALAATPASAAYIYTPGADYETREGNSSNVVFLRDNDIRLQWHFDDTLFGAAPLMINGISFRIDEAATGTFSNTRNFVLGPAFNIRLATLDSGPGTNFDANIPRARTVLSGARTIRVVTPLRDDPTNPFTFHVPFDTPFRYDPAAGNLVMDLLIPKQVNFGNLDFVSGNPAEKRLFSLTPSATGVVQNLGPVARFDVTAAAPEPAAWAMMIAGFGLAGAALRRRRTYAAAHVLDNGLVRRR